MKVAAVAIMALASCGPNRPADGDVVEVPREYLGVQTAMMDDELVNLRIAMKGARGPEDIDGYTRCAAAQYALIKGYGYARHLRTNVAEKGGVWQADAIYTLSAETPRGINIIEAEKVVRDCKAQLIPTV